MDKDLINNQDDEKIRKGSKKKDSSSSKNDEVQEVDKIDKDIVEEENLIFKDKDDSQGVVVDSDMKVSEVLELLSFFLLPFLIFSSS